MAVHESAVITGDVVQGQRRPLHATLAERLKKARQGAGFDRAPLSTAAALAVNTVANIEKGSVPGIDTVEKIARALNVSPCFLAYGVAGELPSLLADRALRASKCGARLQQLREHLDLSKLALAAAASLDGSSILPIESGRISPSVATVEALAAALSCSPCWLAFGEGADPLHDPPRAAAEASAVKYRPPRKLAATVPPHTQESSVQPQRGNHTSRDDSMTLSTSASGCLARICEILGTARRRALQTIDLQMIHAYWHIGREIVEEEQRGDQRAEYGRHLIEQISARLSSEFGRGFSETNIKYIRQFYLTYTDRVEIRHSLSDESRLLPQQRTLPGVLTQPCRTFLPELSWTHYRILLRVNDDSARLFYEAECAKARWSVKELERQIASLLFERLARSRDKEGVLALARQGHEVSRPEDLLKDPYILEFTGLPEAARWQESDLENALIDRLQQFLLELGRDLYFVARQKRLTIDGDHFYIDLVFYHRALRSFLLIDLKAGRLTQQDIGQMLLYTGYFEAHEKRHDENPPIGLILCTDKNDAVVRYTLSQSVQQVFASRYQFHLPTEDELRTELRREREDLEREHLLNDRE